jgi:hypothetical protein
LKNLASVGKFALKAMAGAAAVGAVAAGSIAVGAIAIRRIAIQNFRLKKIDIEELNVARLRVKNIAVTEEISLPENSDNRRKPAAQKRISRKKKTEPEKGTQSASAQ